MEGRITEKAQSGPEEPRAHHEPKNSVLFGVRAEIFHTPFKLDTVAIIM